MKQLKKPARMKKLKKLLKKPMIYLLKHWKIMKILMLLI